MADDSRIFRSDVPGRTCPPSYAYSPRTFARPADLTTEVLYVVGGLYGNALALDAIEHLSAHEPIPPSLVFNGDFHWSDAGSGHSRHALGRAPVSCPA